MSWVSSGLDNPVSIALDNTYAYVTNFDNNTISRIEISNPSNNITWVSFGLNGPRGITLDNNFAYVCNSSNNNISRIEISNPSNNITWVYSGLDSPSGIAFDNTYAYVTNFDNNTISRIEINNPSNNITWVSSGLNAPRGIALDNTYAYVCNFNNIIKIQLSNPSNKISWVSFGLNGPSGIALDNTYAYVCNSDNNTISRIEINNPSNNINWVSGLNGPRGIALDNNFAYVTNIYNNTINKIILDKQPIGCFLADSKVLTNSELVPIQLLKKGHLVQTLNNGLVPIKFVGKRSFFNKLTEERIINHLYKLNKKDFPELLEDLFITGGHPLLLDNVDKETKNKLLDIAEMGAPIITEGKYRVFAFIHPNAELLNKEGQHEIFDIVLENEDPKQNYGIWVNGILTESMDEDFFLNYSEMTEINK